MTQLFSLRPNVYKAWRQLPAAVTENMDARRYELATLAAARAMQCRYCVGAHAAVLESKFYDRPKLQQIMRDFRGAGLSEQDVAIMEFAEKVALHAYKVAEDDVARLRSQSLTDPEIFDVALAAAARSFFSKSLDAMGAQPDPEYEETAQLLDLVQLPLPRGQV
jgi:uncharacterized peroxidase-related enzyme